MCDRERECVYVCVDTLSYSCVYARASMCMPILAHAPVDSKAYYKSPLRLRASEAAERQQEEAGSMLGRRGRCPWQRNRRDTHVLRHLELATAYSRDVVRSIDHRESEYRRPQRVRI